MKIAITGGTGFLGQYLVEEIKKDGKIPIILTRNLLENHAKNAECRSTDYSYEDLKIKLGDINAIIHLAAMRGSQGKISEFHGNQVTTQNLYEVCYELNIENVVFASSISVYSDEDKLPWTELNLPQPELMYGIGKMACEYLGNIYSSKKKLQIKNLRFAHIYGFNEKNNYMINRFFRQAFRKEELSLNAKSVARREFIYAKDAAKAVVCALNTGNNSETFNIGSGEAYTNFEVAEMINEAFRNQNNLLVKDHNADEGIHSSYMDSSKAKDILGFTPDYSFQSALVEIHALMKELEDVPAFY